MNDLLKAYGQVQGKHDLPPMQTGSCDAATQDFRDPEALWAALQGFMPAQGWLQFQSRQMVFSDRLPTPQLDWGLLLSAEAVTAEGDSLAINLDGTGGWRLVRFRHGAAATYLWDEVAQLAHDPKVGKLRYRRYWRLDAEQGFVQDRACFVGYGKE